MEKNVAIEKIFNTQQALFVVIENWKRVLDNKGFAGAVLIGLSKAFGTIIYDLLVSKIHTYGFSNDSLKLLYSYLKIDGIEQKLTINSVHGKS